MGLSYTEQIIVDALVTIVPAGLLGALLLLRIIPPSLAAIGGAILIFLQNRFDDVAVSKYGFSKVAINIGSGISALILFVAVVFLYKELKKWEREKKEQEEDEG